MLNYGCAAAAATRPEEAPPRRCAGSAGALHPARSPLLLLLLPSALIAPRIVHVFSNYSRTRSAAPNIFGSPAVRNLIGPLLRGERPSYATEPAVFALPGNSRSARMGKARDDIVTPTSFTVEHSRLLRPRKDRF